MKIRFRLSPCRRHRRTLPSDEHFLPLLYVAAQRLPGDDVSFFNDVIEGGSISMTGVRIG